MAKAPDHADRDAAAREVLKHAVAVPIEHALMAIVPDPVLAHDIADRIAQVASDIAERAAVPVTMARERLTGIVQRGAVEAVRHLQDGVAASRWMLPEYHVADNIRTHIETRVATERVRSAQAQPGQVQVAQQLRDHRPEIARQGGEPGRVVPSPGRQQAREHQRGER